MTMRTRLGLILGLVLFAAALAAPAPAGMPEPAWRAAAVALLMAVWWVTEAIPIPATALLPLVLFPLLGVLPIGEAAAPYANPVIYLFMGGFLIAAALERCGLHRRMALVIIRAGGTQPARLIGAFMVATAFLSMWVSNTATVAMMLPLALSIVAVVRAGETGEVPRDPHFGVAMLLGLAYASNIGGVGTLIGTPPNALLAGFMSETYGVTIGFQQWMLLGVPIVVVALPITWLLLTRVMHPVARREIAGGRAVVRAQMRELGPATRAEWTVGVITAMTAGAWVFRPQLADFAPGLSDPGIAIGGALLLFLVPATRDGRPALDWAAAERLPWGVLVLFGGGLSLAAAIQGTGLADWIGASLAFVGGWPLLPVVLVVSTVVIFLTELTSNTATTAAFLPVVGALATAIFVDPLLLAVPMTVAASCAFMMPVATPPNAIVYGSGEITIGQMLRAGFVLNIIMIIVVSGAAVVLVPALFSG
jgi:sodium-dependent dicarboxylate transporter 2/3/5